MGVGEHQRAYYGWNSCGMGQQVEKLLWQEPCGSEQRRGWGALLAWSRGRNIHYSNPSLWGLWVGWPCSLQGARLGACGWGRGRSAGMGCHGGRWGQRQRQQLRPLGVSGWGPGRVISRGCGRDRFAPSGAVWRRGSLGKFRRRSCPSRVTVLGRLLMRHAASWSFYRAGPCTGRIGGIGFGFRGYRYLSGRHGQRLGQLICGRGQGAGRRPS